MTVCARWGCWACAGSVVAVLMLSGCSPKKGDVPAAAPDKSVPPVAVAPADGAGAADAADVQPAAPAGTASAGDVQAAKTLLDGFGAGVAYTLKPGDLLTRITIQDGSVLTAEHIALFGKLSDLEVLQIYNFRALNDEMAAQLSGLSGLTTLALTNSVIGDPTVEMVVKSFPNLTDLDLSSNTNMTNGALKVISELTKLERLTLVQNRFNDIGTLYLEKLKNLRALDLRGNMEAGDLTMEVVAELPKLASLRHRSTTVSDYGMEALAQNKSLSSLLIQDFVITGESGQYMAQLEGLSQLEIFRCQGFSSDGVLALKGMKLSRLTLRDLPMIDDRAMEVFTDMPQLTRLYLHELASVSDAGLQHLSNLQSLEVLDIWTVPQMTDATLDAIAALPNLKELSIRTTAITDAAVDKVLAMPNLQSLNLKDNAQLTAEALKKLSERKWTKLEL